MKTKQLLLLCLPPSSFPIVASKRHVRQRACGDKRRYETAEDGRAAIYQLNRGGYKGHMNVYKCKFCHGYHVGHAPK